MAKRRNNDTSIVDRKLTRRSARQIRIQQDVDVWARIREENERRAAKKAEGTKK